MSHDPRQASLGSDFQVALRHMQNYASNMVVAAVLRSIDKMGVACATHYYSNAMVAGWILFVQYLVREAKRIHTLRRRGVSSSSVAWLPFVG